MTDDEVYEYLGQTFEWNRMKAMRNTMKHRVRFTEAATVYFDENALVRTDEENSDEEQRYTLIGHSVRLRSLFVVHVLRGARIRIVSARRATPTERRAYEARLGR